MTEEPINIQQYHKDYVKTLSWKDQQAIRRPHLDRMQQGKDEWNTWAKQVLAAIEQTYPANASEAEKLAIRNQYQIDFSGVKFKENANFRNFIFPIAVVFSGVAFSGEADFRRAIFSGEANFFQATFSGEARFWGTTFSGRVHFVRATFSGEVTFFEATFSSGGYFLQATFSGETISFFGAQFQQQVLFLDLQFADTAIAVPCDFRQVDFHFPPLVDSFPSNLSQFIQANAGKQRDQEFYQVCEGKFRALKQLAEGNNHHQKALEFYGCELYCQRRASNGARNPKNWASYLYGGLSAYGLSLLRPALLWFFISLFCITLQANIDDNVSVKQTNHGLIATVEYEALDFYAAPSMPPFVSKPLYQKEVRHRLYPKDAEKPAGQLPPFNRAVRFFQTLTTFVALFLVGLALRNRFKIK